jgi:pteridine reductase
MPRRAIVIGAARRVGRAVALEFARAGWDLVLTYRSRQAEALETAAEARRIGAAAGRPASITVERLELSDLAAVERFGHAHAVATVDALVLSAAAYSRTPFGEITAATAESEMRINAVAPLLLVQALAPALACSSLAGGGSVIAFGDIHAMGRPRRAFAPYLMSKAAIHCMVESLALELGPAVRVNAVAPGFIETDMTNVLKDEQKARITQAIPMGRIGRAEEVAAAVRFLASDEASYITGNVIDVNGGMYMR